MTNIMLFTIIAALTIASPGPGLLLTLSNTLKYRLAHALWGIVGVVCGMATIAAIASSSLGVVLIASPWALNGVKVAGAAYLIYLGVKLFRSKPKGLGEDGLPTEVPAGHTLFREAFMITLFNPKPIVFFMALFPQFIDPSMPMGIQFLALSSIFCILVFMIHLGYGCFAMAVRQKLSGDTFFVILNRVAGVVFMGFGLSLGISAFV